MSSVWQVLIMMLPALLQSLRGSSATTPYFKFQQNFDQMLKDELALTRHEDTVITWDQDAVRDGDESKLNFRPASSNLPHTITESHHINTDRGSAKLASPKPSVRRSEESVLIKMLKRLKSQGAFSERTFLINSSQNNWGSHPIGTQESFLTSTEKGSPKWSAYFYDQAVVAVLQTENGTMLKCTVQENIEEWEQEEALRFLGEIMPLKPIPFNSMVHLITLCGTLNMPPPQPIPPESISDMGHLWWLGLSTLQGILPGTLWCGMQDTASHYHQLGSRQKLDACCRAHDHCPIKLSSLASRYGVTNFNIKTISHCSCDLEFFRCLKGVKSRTANMVGQLYFNYFRMECLDAPPTEDRRIWSSPVSSKSLEQQKTPSQHPPRGSVGPTSRSPQESAGRLDCIRVDWEGGCRKWVLKPKDFSIQLVVTQLGLNF